MQIDSWENEWLKNAHSSDEYKQHISEMQYRIVNYMAEIESLRQAIATIYTVALKNLRD